jgi:mRNA interferase RelE/StbE
MKIELKPQAIQDLQCPPISDATRITAKLSEMEARLIGDINRLTNFTPEYRLRIGNNQGLLEVEETAIVLYCVAHRKHGHRRRAHWRGYQGQPPLSLTLSQAHFRDYVCSDEKDLG